MQEEMRTTDQLKPEKVFTFFKEICSIPHGSRNMQQISDYLVDFAKKRGLFYRQDEAKNVLIKKPASAGAENAPGVILQGHIDMVAVKDRGVEKDLSKEGLETYVEGDWLRAKGTSLGGDDGIAVAYALAVLDDETLVHPAIEAIFTTDEEIGLLGAAAFDTSDVEGKLLFNMDSEDEGIFTVSCAGGGCAVCHLPVSFETAKGQLLHVTLTGLTGGHSGVEINTGRANSNVSMGRILNEVSKKAAFKLVSVKGGEKDNAIANETQCSILVDEKDKETVAGLLQKSFASIKEEAAVTDPDMKLLLEEKGIDELQAMTEESTRKVLLLINVLPNGVMCMSPDIPDMVQTSLNLGILDTREEEVVLLYSVRSSKASQKENLIERLRLLTTYAGGTFEVEGEYPGWDYKPDSVLLGVMVDTYRELFHAEPVVEGIHAGLECGVFASKIEGLDAVSFGPQMHHVHTTREELSVSSVERTYQLVTAALEKLAQLK